MEYVPVPKAAGADAGVGCASETVGMTE